MYDGDTFFHLGMIGRIGLVAISGIFGAATIWAAWRLGRNAHWPTRLLVGLGAFLLFEWLAPQVHYLWYVAVIDDLPVQWVIGPFPRPWSAVEVLLFQVEGSLSARARAWLGWFLVALLVIAGRFKAPPKHL